MFKRDIFVGLEKWRNDDLRKPLVLRGPRQVGKTTVVNEFGKTFANYLYYNLENAADRAILEMALPMDDLVTLLFAHRNVVRVDGQTLLFIDEIQNSPQVIARLRYFYEQCPGLHVIAAGSLLENIVDINVSFPVGRVEYMALRPCSYREFLGALGKDNLLHFIDNPSLSYVCHDALMSLFNQYTVVGGMPEIVQRFAKHRDLLAMDNTYESLLQSYRDDVEKYVRGSKITEVVRFILSYGWAMAGQIVTLGKFGGSEYNAREIGEAFRLLEKALVAELVYPSTAVDVPAIPEHKRMPKLLWFDTGLVNYATGVRKEVIGSLDIMDAWRGRIAEQVVAQELLALNNRVGQRRSFWLKSGGGGSAEVDFTWTVDSRIIPIEVKSGHNSRLRSIHSFIDKSQTDVAVRVWSQPFSVDEVKTSGMGKPFRLINLPFYMVCNLERIVRPLLM